MVPLLLLLLSPAQASGERCGPTRCGADESCCNETCGMCVTEGMVCIQPDCGWARREVGGALPVFLPRALQPTSTFEVDQRIDAGRVGDVDLARWRGDLRVPVSRSVVLAGGLEGRGRVREEGGERAEDLEWSVVWAPPSGSVSLHHAVEIGGWLGREVPLDGGRGWLLGLGRQASGAPFRPGFTVGASLLRASPRWFFLSSSAVSLSGRLLVVPEDEVGADVGYEVSAAVSQNFWGNVTFGWMVGGGVSRRPGWTPTVDGVVGLYVMARPALQVGVEGGPAWMWDGDRWADGARVGVRIDVFAEPGQVRQVGQGIADWFGGLGER